MLLPDFSGARRWAFERALPFWAEAGADRARGGFHEVLDTDGRPVDLGYRRVRVTCRQMYVFAHAHTLGWAGGVELACHGFEWLVGHGWQGPDRGWARRLDERGVVVDPTADLYDHAFVLFGLAWHHAATGDPSALEWAHRTLDFVEAHLRHPSGEGFLHARPAEGPRLQNPHMHLLEAALALWETSRDARFARLAFEVVTLFETRFFDRRTGTLGERFTEDLRRAPGDDGRLVEPGHMFEWAWILANYHRSFGAPVTDTVRRLVAFAERHGVDPVTQATLCTVRDDGTALDASSRTWPNTERIKGHLGLFLLDGTDPTAPVARATQFLLDRYLSPRGMWRDHFDRDGTCVAELVPASTLYHVFLAISELLRHEDGLRALPRRAAAATRRARAPGGVPMPAGGAHDGAPIQVRPGGVVGARPPCRSRVGG